MVKIKPSILHTRVHLLVVLVAPNVACESHTFVVAAFFPMLQETNVSDLYIFFPDGSCHVTPCHVMYPSPLPNCRFSYIDNSDVTLATFSSILLPHFTSE